MCRSLTTEQFIERAKSIHGDKYDYSKTEYANFKTKVCITCLIHGDFLQSPHKHLIGHGCPLCGKARRADKKRLPTNEFIRRARSVHGDKYDYSKVKYITQKYKVSIICPVHGEFWQTPDSHTRGIGCPECARIASKQKIHGVGINDYQGRVKKDGKNIQSYHIWQQMLSRCCCSTFKERYPTYKDCSVCDEWKYFSKFKEWFDAHYVEGWHLDKDILVKGNKYYSPDTCCFVPAEINCMWTKCDKRRGEFPIGVSYINAKNKFLACMSVDKKTTMIGYYDNYRDAFQAYKIAKEAHIKDIADKWKGKIEEKVYMALYSYQVEEGD